MVYLQAVLYFGLMTAYGFHYLTMLQQTGYKYKANLKSQSFFLFNSILLLSGGIVITTLCAFLDVIKNSIIISSFLYVMLFYLAISYFLKRQKFVFTPRGRRLFSLYVLFCLILSTFFFIKIQYLLFVTLFVTLFLSPFLCLLCLIITQPFETKKNNRFIAAAKEKLSQNSTLIKVGITGSFAKTSCKYILSEMLQTAYNVHPTEASYNTPLGIAKSVCDLNKAADIFIAEMGARKQGDIKELMDIVKPRYAIMTGVTCQHLETFRTVENIFKEKEQLVKCLPADGFCVFNGENTYSKYMYNKAKIEKRLVGFDESFDIYAENVKTDQNGSSFDMAIDGERLKCRTRLLGKHNIINILLCSALAKQLGITNSDLRKAIISLEPPPHRLQVIKSPNGITIIDDSYNCNLEGAICALETLDAFEGRKVVFSQGIIELGPKQKETNKYLGYLISKVADMVILCGENSHYIKEGLMDRNFQGNIHVYKSLLKAQKDFLNILKQGDTLLIQNDLPDYY
ncbi:MAG: UDP-N-acetylmuramoyl-tripeptide--D-alanyl-D-alanine ligase [Clostridia bacterium]